MKVKLALGGLAALTATLFAATATFAEPANISDDEGYGRLSHWESHLEQRITSGVQQRWLNPYRAWQLQKQLGNVEVQSVQAYYQSENGIDHAAFHRFAEQLRAIGEQLGERGWDDENWGRPGYGPDSGYGPPPGPGFGPGDGPQGYNAPPPPNAGYYQPGGYEEQCHRSNTAAGTIFGALGGGLIGGAASHGNGAAIVGGVVLGGLVGNALSRDIDCDDHRYAFPVYDQAFNGEIGREYRWQHADHYGTIVAVREYDRGGRVCRDFHAVNHHEGRSVVREGTVCRGDEGHWRFD
ncbi:MAG TPA: hypothetical protein VN154_10500 [Rhizomicrobium sp.]|nr:hypothetical protein [Rhizomicrobium sp.]